MASLVKAWRAALSAVLFWAAFPPLNLGLIVFVALAPWLISLKNTDGKGAVKSGLVFGFLFLAAQMSWLQPLTVRWTGSIGLSLVPALLCPLIGMFYFALLGWLIHVCWRKKWIWAIPLVWAGIEVVRSYMPGLAFPWGLAGTPLWPYPALIQLAWFGSIFLVSAWVLIANLAVARLMAGEGFMQVRNLAMAFVFLGIGSSMRLSNPEVGAKTAITIGQLGLDLAFGDRAEVQARIAPTVESFRGTAAANGSQLLVLPEGLVRRAETLPPPTPFAVDGGVPILFGGQRGTGPTFQTAFAYDGEWKYVDKTRLVVFGEYVPGRDFLPFLDSFKLPTGDLTPGEKVSALTVGGIRVGPLLCFEGLFPDVGSAQARNDVQLLAVMALDDWYFGTAAPDQLRTAAVFRAIEAGVPLVRCAPLGYSMAVDARGRVIAEAPTGKTVPMRVEVVLPAHPDFFAGIDGFRYLALLSCLLVIGAALRDRFATAPKEV